MLETNNKEKTDTLEDPYLQYVIFCSRFMEEHGHASVVGMLDAVDVSGTIKRGQPSPRKMFPITMVIGIIAPPGTYDIRLEIFRPSGGMSTSLNLDQFDIFEGSHLHRCIADLEMEAPEDGTYSFRLFINGALVGKAILPITFAISYTD